MEYHLIKSHQIISNSKHTQHMVKYIQRVIGLEQLPLNLTSVFMNDKLAIISSILA